MRVCWAALIGVVFLFAASSASALGDGRELHRNCSNQTAFSEGYCEGFIAGVLAAHLSPWVINLQKGQKYICIPHTVTPGQSIAVVRKFLEENPNRRNYRADTNVWMAFTEAYPCR